MTIKRTVCFILAIVLCAGVLAGCADLESMIPGMGRLDPALLDRAPETAGAPDNTPATAAPTVPASTMPAETEPNATEPAPTEPAPTEAAKPANLLKQNQKKINVFLSNFAEAYFEEFPASDYDMLQFVYIYCMINNDKKIKYDDDVDYIVKKDVDTIIKDFFGKKITPDEEGEWFYDDYPEFGVMFDGKRYEFEPGGGENYDRMAVAKSMIDNGDGTYTVEFDIYYAENGLKSSYYEYTAAKAADSSKLERVARGTAVVREYTRSTGKESYQLIKYTLK